MHKTNFNGSRFIAVVACAFVSAGLAWAMVTRTEPVPAGNTFYAECELVPGADGAVVYGKKPSSEDPLVGEDWVDFSIGFESDGTIDVNGETGPDYGAYSEYRLEIDGYKSASTWYVTTRILDRATNDLLFTQQSYAMAGKPEDIVAKAKSIALLIVTP